MRTLPADPTQAGRDKAQRAILAVLHAADAPTPVHVDEIARRAPCRGIHFGALERAAQALTRRGLLEHVGDGYRLAQVNPASKLRGHEIVHDGDTWRFADTGERTVDTWRERGCGHCNRLDTVEGHDACLGTLPGVMNACCGHGDARAAYVQLDGGKRLAGPDAVRYFGNALAESETA